MNRKILLTGIPLLAAACLAAVWALTVRPPSDQPVMTGFGGEILNRLKASKTLDRKVSRDEYEFFETLVKRDLWKPSERELEEKTKRMILEVNAKFALGQYLGVSKLYTYETMLADLAGENTGRERMKQAGEVFYGPESFDGIGYFGFIYSNLDLAVVTGLRESAGDTLEAEVRAFYEENPERFERLEEVEYELTINGITEVKTADRSDIRGMYQADGELGAFLMGSEGRGGEAGAVFEDEFESGAGTVRRRARILSVAIGRTPFEEAGFNAAHEYLAMVYYPEIIESAIRLSKLGF